MIGGDVDGGIPCTLFAFWGLFGALDQLFVIVIILYSYWLFCRFCTQGFMVSLMYMVVL